MQMPEDVIAAVQDKQQRDDAQIADLVSRGTPVPAVRTTPTAACTRPSRPRCRAHNVDEDGVLRAKIASPAGTIPANIRLPPSGERRAVAAQPRARPKSSTGSVTSQWFDAAAAGAAVLGGGSMFGNMFSSSGNASAATIIRPPARQQPASRPGAPAA